MKKIYLIIIMFLLTSCLIGCGEKQPDNNGNNNNNIGDNNDNNNNNNNNQEETKKYIITFIDENNNTLESKEWEEGTIPSFSYSVSDTEEWDYTFEGWSETKDGSVLQQLPKVSAETSYYAIVSKVKQVYTLSFDTLGGSEIESVTVEYGSTINEPAAPVKDNHRFMGWSTSKTTINAVQWPITLKSDTCIYAVWNEKVDIKSYLSMLMNTELNPYSFIPKSMLADNVNKHVSKEEVTYNFSVDTKVSDIKYGGFGDQWNMVLNNLNQSETFYNVLTTSEIIINSTIVAFNNYLDKNIEDTASHQIKNSEYTAEISFKDNILSYTLQLETSLNIPLIGNVTPQIHMELNVETGEKTARIQLNDNNAIKYVINEDSYLFVIEYGIDNLSRKAMFFIERKNGKVDGHIFEFIKLKDSDVVSSSAQFYINNEYVSVVGNKTSKIIAFDGYINELYLTSSGKLLGYEVREELTFASVTKQYNTLWFNLNEFDGIKTIKAVENKNAAALTGTKNPHDIYLNGDSKVFKPKHNTVLLVETSRKYDIELRTQYFYGYEDEKLVEYKTEIPMLFVQAEDLNDLVSYLASNNKISTNFNLNSKYIAKIQSDYGTLVDEFILFKDTITSDMINDLIGERIELK